MLAFFSIAAGLIVLLLAGCFAMLVAISAKIDAYRRVNGEEPPEA
jgi:hypothetical protein